MQDERKSTNVFIRLRPSVKAAGEQAAREANRSFSSWIETVLIERLRADGYLPADGKPGKGKPK